ncbi:hypothetical protein AA310_02705 [Arthrobacter sp. YC-RL1]|nr:hypothetical protein AA310_02705 [Arthrobacter sp. YC-RL1]
MSSGAVAGATLSALPTAAASLSKQTSALYRAIEDGKPDAVRKAVKAGADLHAKDSSGRTPLMRAVIVGNAAICKHLLDAGSDPNAKDDYQESPFLRASASGMVSTLSAFLDKGADTRSTNRVGGTALSVAAENGQVGSVRALLKTDIPVDHVNDLGWTALHETIVLGQGTTNSITIARLLVTHGANPTLKDQTGSDAFTLARERQQTQMLNMLVAASS